ncbi:hypothetical protein Mgra_00003451 [Meloidogyne graminicola]|uniref:Uncharacterized protein n=1 Tax=Meloidogyne graminicola TaxID=189291 RepID=A0A8S9ZU08_9BILA|nr:hypothetical protein Mgra_00003451 [Meloidogyne graminicola]
MFKKTKINFLNNLKMSSDTNTIIDKANKILEKQSFKTNAESDPEINTLIEYYAYANENYQRSKERLDKDEEILIKAAARILKKDSSFVNQSGLKRPLIDTDELQHEVSQKKSKQEEMMKKSCCGVSLTTGCKCSFTSGIDVALCSSERGQTSGTSQVDDGTDCSTTNV